MVWREDRQYKLALSVVSVASQCWQDSNVALGAPDAANRIPAKVPSYTIADLPGDWYVMRQVRLLGGISNLSDKTYYNRVFSGGLEPGLSRTFHVGAAYGF